MSERYEHVTVETRAEWRRWLAKHHASSPGVWAVTYKKGTARPRSPTRRSSRKRLLRLDRQHPSIDRRRAIEAARDPAQAEESLVQDQQGAGRAAGGGRHD